MKQRHFQTFKTARIYHQQTYTVRDVKEYPAGRRQVTPHGNQDLHQGKNTGNGNHGMAWEIYVIPFLII